MSIRSLSFIRDATRRWRIPLTVLGFVIFVVGISVSVLSLDLRLSDLKMLPLLVVFFVLSPVMLAIGAVTLQISAHVVGVSLGFRHSFVAVAAAGVAEMLPIPGGALVRGATLVKSGASIGESGWIVTITALLTLCLSIAFAAGALLYYGHSSGLPVLIISLVGLGVCMFVIARRSTAMVILPIVAIRLLTLLVGTIRMIASFAALGVSIAPIKAVLFIVSTTLGSAVSIIPAGLGIGEGIAVALAALVDVPIGLAFLAVALNRIIGLLFSAVVTGAALLFSPSKPEQ